MHLILWKGEEVYAEVGVGALVVAGIKIKFHVPVILSKNLYCTVFHILLLLNRLLFYFVNITQRNGEIVIEVQRKALVLGWGACGKD